VIQWHVGPLPTTLLEVSILASVGVFALETVLQGSAVQWRTPYTWAAILLLLAGGLSVLVPSNHIKAAGLYRAYFIEPIAFFIVVAATVDTIRRAGLLLLSMAAGGSVVAVLNSAVVLNAIRHHTLDLALSPPVVIYTTANAVALYLIPLVAVAAGVLVYTRSPRERFLSAAFLVLGLAGSLLSFSRGGYLALAAIAIVLAATHRRARWLVPSAILAMALLVQVPLIRDRIAYELHRVEGNTLDWRLRVWGQTIKMMREHLFFGVGLSNYKQAMGPYWEDLPQVIYPHNILLNFWTVTGVLGVLAFGWLVATGLMLSWRGSRRGPEAWRPYQLGIVLFLAGVLAHGLVDVPFFKNDLSLEFFTLLAIGWAGLSRADPGQTTSTGQAKAL
jgi:O-antigen ligase